MDWSKTEEAAVPAAVRREPEAPPSPAPAGEAEARRLPPRVVLAPPALRRAPAPAAAPASALRAAPADLGVRHGRRLRERAIEIVLFMNGMAAIVIIGLIFVFLFREGVAAFRDIDSRQFVGGTEIKSTYDVASDTFTEAREFATVWQPVSAEPKYSLIPLVSGSLLVALPATLISTVLGVLVGIYLAEIARHRVREVVKPAIELLAGIPTVIIGFIMLTIVATFVQQITHSHFRLNAFVGAIGVSLVIIPVIASLTEDALRAVPEPLRLASYALGATRWQTVSRVVVPAAVSGITAAALLGFGRALGETMIVLMATGNAALVTGNILSSVRTMTATIAAELGAVARDSEQYHALFFVGAVLFAMTFIFNMIAEVIVSRMRRRLRM